MNEAPTLCRMGKGWVPLIKSALKTEENTGVFLDKYYEIMYSN